MREGRRRNSRVTLASSSSIPAPPARPPRRALGFTYPDSSAIFATASSGSILPATCVPGAPGRRLAVAPARVAPAVVAAATLIGEAWEPAATPQVGVLAAGVVVRAAGGGEAARAAGVAAVRVVCVVVPVVGVKDGAMDARRAARRSAAEAGAGAAVA